MSDDKIVIDGDAFAERMVEEIIKGVCNRLAHDPMVEHKLAQIAAAVCDEWQHRAGNAGSRARSSPGRTVIVYARIGGARVERRFTGPEVCVDLLGFPSSVGANLKVLDEQGRVLRFAMWADVDEVVSLNSDDIPEVNS